MKQRIRHWPSTLIGLLLVLGGGYLVKTGHATLTEVVGALVTIMGLLGFAYKKKGDSNG